MSRSFFDNGGTKRWHEHAGSGASIACEMPTVFSDLLAPRESVRKAYLLLSNVPINTQVNGRSAKKEMKSGSLAPPLPQTFGNPP
jgi:hypothetical protein